MMSFFDIIRFSASNLYQRKARTLLTVLGVIIGTMSIVLMVALGEGTKQAFMKNVTANSDLTQITVSAGNGSSAGANAGGARGKDTGKLNDAGVKKVEAISGVKGVIPVANVSINLKNARYVADLSLLAAPLDKLKVYEKKVEWGKLPRTSNIIQLALGSEQKSNFHLKRANNDIWSMPTATDIDLKTEKFDIYFGGYSTYNTNNNTPVSADNPPPDYTIPDAVGKAVVSAGFSKTGGDLDYNGFIDIKALQKFVKNNKKFCSANGISADYQQFYVYAKTIDDVESIMTSLKDLGYNASSPMEWIKQMQKQSEQMQAVWGMVGAIALIVSAIGIINTMLMSIMERKKEIGILKVLGCSLFQINAIFLSESAFIGLLGGAIGLGLSFAVAASSANLGPLSSLLGGNESQVSFVITPTLAIMALLGAMLIGMMAGIYPAARAMKMPALAALREE